MSYCKITGEFPEGQTYAEGNLQRQKEYVIREIGLIGTIYICYIRSAQICTIFRRLQ